MGAAEDVVDVLRRYGREDFLSLAESVGLTRAGPRFQCPFPGCSDKGPGRTPNVSVMQGKDGCWHLRCWRCDAKGRYVDLYMAVKGVDFGEAMEQLRGYAATAPSRPQLRVVPPPAADEGKLKPEEVERTWLACREADEAGEAYLAKRGLHECVGMGLVRFAHEAHANTTMARQAKGGYRIVALLRDLTGAPRGLQMRLAREALPSDRSKVTSLKGSVLGGAWFGRPELFEAAGVVVVAEGLADSLAAARWVGDWDGACVLGAPGKSNLHRVVDEARAIGLDVSGRVFVLLPQNDRPVNASRREFDRLAKAVTAAGGQVVWCNVPDEVKDFAQWAQEAPSDVPTWPPVEVRRALGLVEGEGAPAAEALVTPIDGALPVPQCFTCEENEANLGTLLAALDDVGMRHAILRRRGDFAWNEMTQRPGFARVDLSASDWTTIRAGLEAHVRNSSGKKLKFGREDIADAVTLLARRASFHPVRDYLNSLTWDGVPRLDSALPRALGLEEYGFHAALLRRWAISAVARVMKPGCKVDTMLVLVGPQGTGKSTFFSVLGGAFFSDQAIDLHDKDGRMVLHSAWVLEWAELDSMRRARDADAIKAFLTQRVDKFRPPYGRDIIEAPRSCVIVGTTNDEQFLSDPTGNRRFWPVPVRHRVDIPAVAAMRDQVWAEALAAYVAGEEWHLEGDMEALAAAEVLSYVEADAWEPLVRRWLVGKEARSPLSTADVLAEAIEKPIGQWTRGDEMRVGRILARQGWERRRIRRGSKLYWGYVPTDADVLTTHGAES